MLNVCSAGFSLPVAVTHMCQLSSEINQGTRKYINVLIFHSFLGISRCNGAEVRQNTTKPKKSQVP